MINSGATLNQVKRARVPADYDPRYGVTSGPWTTNISWKLCIATSRNQSEESGDASVKITVHAFLIALAVALLGGGHAAAHHSFAAEFDAQKPVTLKGTVVKWEMINPHGWITLAVPGA